MRDTTSADGCGTRDSIQMVGTVGQSRDPIRSLRFGLSINTKDLSILITITTTITIITIIIK